ncbi:hypothetical protein K1719_025450 [Acacia pycnantha]|nr:hypothetical protein K1719_025450 [Acacia pycnantha]
MAIVLSKKASVKVPSSNEEEDLLQRSSKKIKNGDGHVVVEEWPSLGQSSKKPWINGQSFAEKLQGTAEAVEEDGTPLCEIREDPNRNFPTFLFSDRMKRRLYKAWDNVVIVKLLGKSIGYKLLLSILQSLWAKRGVIRLINIGNRFFVVKFSNKEDYNNALTGGPWMIFDHYLTDNGEDVSLARGEQAVPIVVDADGSVHGRRTEKSPKEKKNSGKKKMGQSGITGSSSNGQSLGKHELKREKRMREIVTSESTGGEILRRPSGESKVADKYLCTSEERVCVEERMIDPVVSEPPDAIIFLSDSLDPGDAGECVGPAGKFWNVARDYGPDLGIDMGGQVGSRSLVHQIQSVCLSPNPCMLSLSETKCESENQLFGLKSLGFDGFACVPSIGRSGGLVAVWRTSQIGVTVLRLNRDVACLGDFNDIASASERIGGARPNFSRMNQFLDRINDCVFAGDISVADSNKTLIALIPKRDSPEQFPIMFCGTAVAFNL